MTAGNNTTLVDTNLVVYAYDPSEARKQHEARVALAYLRGRGGVLFLNPFAPDFDLTRL